MYMKIQTKIQFGNGNKSLFRNWKESLKIKEIEK